MATKEDIKMIIEKLDNVGNVVNKLDSKLDNVISKLDNTNKKFDNIDSKLDNITNILDNDLKALISVQQRLIHERLGVPMPAEPTVGICTASATKTNNRTINIDLAENGKIRVSGKNTYDFKDAIKGNRMGTFEAGTKTWLVPSSDLSGLISRLEGVGLTDGTDFVVSKELRPERETVTEKDAVGTDTISTVKKIKKKKKIDTEPEADANCDF